MKVLVLAGGSSAEREVSLRSGQTVAEALQAGGHDVVMYDPVDAATNLGKIAEGCDVAFPAMHGAGGEDGVIQQELERLGLAYVGSDVDSSELCFDKWNYRALLESRQLPMARGALMDRETFWQSDFLAKPFVLKPPKGGSSIDTLLVHDPAKLPKTKIDAIFDKHLQMLVEELVIGTEITMGILGDAALPAIEIIPPSGGDFDYENKYNGASQELCPPQHVSEEVQESAQQLAKRIHTLCGCQDVSRTDMIVSPDGRLTVLETNTIPGLTSESLFPKAAKASGLSMVVLCDQLVTMAHQRNPGY